MSTAIVRRSLLRGVAAALLVAAAATSTVAEEPVVLHVVRDPATPAATAAE